MFLLGNTEKNEGHLEKELAEEVGVYGDVIREDFLDTYQNLTLKTLAGVKWAGHYCSQVVSFICVKYPTLLSNIPG